MRLAIHTVFILKENILFLEEWIKYHILLGFNKFYLYDNSKVEKSGGCHPNHACFVPGKVSKYNINYDKIVNMTNKQMYDYLKKLCDKYQCIEIIEWSPKNKEGKILHNQPDAHNDCLKKMIKDNIDWCAIIDMDEYIVTKKTDTIDKYINSLPQNIKNIQIGQTRFESRFNHLDKLVTDITNVEKKQIERSHSNKNIFNVSSTSRINIHNVNLKNAKNHKNHKPSLNEILFNHYKINSKEHVTGTKSNINPNIKSNLNKDSFIKFENNETQNN